MLMHIVSFTFKSPWSWASLQAIEAERETRDHPNHIAEIKGWTCGRNIARRKIAADFVVAGLFNNREELEAYLVHPNHQQGVAKWQAIADWVVVDIDLESDFTLNTGLLSALGAAGATYN
ncbi:Dabb family protein [Kalamiella sp. sgz302252]|uniref:Dabb family protein n=1 Tax=Pantoea sp. sgz302252 TaxID=3341827 RepID=UPI0036D3A9B4